MRNKWTIFTAIIGYLVLVVAATTIIGFVRNGESFFYNLAAAIILSWIVTLVVYYIWAIYFYNVNMGWEDDDWDELKRKKGDSTELMGDEPKKNPHHEETLGLPPGTVRGTIAISLLVAGLAVVIASFSFKQTMGANEYYIDNFEFFKTAFLMMIAFYFGNKSLDFLKDRKQVYGGSDQGSNSGSGQGSTQSGIPSPVSAGAAKKTMREGAVSETEDTTNSTDFDDKEAQG
jgi:hypothetical protein